MIRRKCYFSGSFKVLILSMVLVVQQPVQANAVVTKCAALTFDDGPSRRLTTRVLDILDTYNAKGTFYLVGNKIARNADIVRRMYRAGHEIGNLSWSHAYLTKLSSSSVKRQIARTDQAIVAITGSRPKTLRPPYGAINRRVKGIVPGRPFIMWNVDSNDYRYRSTSRTINTVLRNTRPGSVVLLHDIHISTVNAVETIVKKLQSKGYSLVTVSELNSGNCEKLRPIIWTPVRSSRSSVPAKSKPEVVKATTFDFSFFDDVR